MSYNEAITLVLLGLLCYNGFMWLFSNSIRRSHNARNWFVTFAVALILVWFLQ